MSEAGLLLEVGGQMSFPSEYKSIEVLGDCLSTHFGVLEKRIVANISYP